MNEKKLYMVFEDTIGENMNIIVDDPKIGLTEDEVRTSMTNILDANAFVNKGADLKAINSAYTVEKVKTEIIKKTA